MHSRHVDRHAASALANINITPLVDVMLVLLVIFMLTLPMVTDTTPMILPQQAPPNSETPPPERRIELTAEGQLRWDGRALSAVELDAELRGLSTLPDATRPPLRIVAEGEVRYARVLRLLAKVHDLGFTAVRLDGR